MEKTLLERIIVAGLSVLPFAIIAGIIALIKFLINRKK